MSMNIYSGIAVGWRFTVDQLMEQFGKTIPEVSHMEDRWDPKTGVQIDPVKVVDRKEQTVIEIGDKQYNFDYDDFDYDDLAEFAEDLWGRFESRSIVYSIIYNHEDETQLIIGLNLPKVGNEVSGNMMHIASDLKLVPDIVDRAENLRSVLNAYFKAQLGPASIINTTWLSC